MPSTDEFDVSPHDLILKNVILETHQSFNALAWEYAKARGATWGDGSHTAARVAIFTEWVRREMYVTFDVTPED